MARARARVGLDSAAMALEIFRPSGFALPARFWRGPPPCRKTSTALGFSGAMGHICSWQGGGGVGAMHGVEDRRPWMHN